MGTCMHRVRAYMHDTLHAQKNSAKMKLQLRLFVCCWLIIVVYGV